MDVSDIIARTFRIIVKINHAEAKTIDEIRAKENEAHQWCSKKFGRPSYVRVTYPDHGGEPTVAYTRPNAFWLPSGATFYFWKDTNAVLEFKMLFG